MRSETLLTLTTFKQVDMFNHVAYCAIQPQNDKPIGHAFHSGHSRAKGFLS